MLADGGKNTSTIRRALAAITHAHRLRGLEPTHEAVRSVMAGIRRKLGAKPERKQGLRALEEFNRQVPGLLIDNMIHPQAALSPENPAPASTFGQENAEYGQRAHRGHPVHVSHLCSEWILLLSRSSTEPFPGTAKV